MRYFRIPLNDLRVNECRGWCHRNLRISLKPVCSYIYDDILYVPSKWEKERHILPMEMCWLNTHFASFTAGWRHADGTSIGRPIGMDDPALASTKLEKDTRKKLHRIASVALSKSSRFIHRVIALTVSLRRVMDRHGKKVFPVSLIS